jgi:hypothetical protein
VNADHRALLPWKEDLMNGITDLLQIETVPLSPFRPTTQPPQLTSQPKRKVVLVDDEESELDSPEIPEEPLPRIIDTPPTKLDSKHPSLRRAALVLLQKLIASVMKTQLDFFDQKYDIRIVDPTLPNDRLLSKIGVPTYLMEKATVVSGYLATTDQDETVREHAEAVLELIETFRSNIMNANEEREFETQSGLKNLKLF